MLAEVNEAKIFLRRKFGDNVPDGIYAIPTKTSKGNAYMKVTITDGFMFGFELFWDEELTKDWFGKK